MIRNTLQARLFRAMLPSKVWRTAVGVVVASATAIGCRPDAFSPPSNDMASLLWSIQPNSRAVILGTAAPYDTVQLEVVGYSANGEILTGLPEATFTSQDSTQVHVAPGGLVTAKKVTAAAGVRITVELEAQGQKYVDTVMVRVVSGEPVALSSFKIIRPAGDTTAEGRIKLPSASLLVPSIPLKLIGEKIGGGTTNDLIAYFSSSNPDVATINRTTGVAGANGPGKVTFYATSVIHGTLWRDSVAFEFTERGFVLLGARMRTPIGTLEPEVYFHPSRVVVSAGAYVFWQNYTGVPVDVTFDDPSAASAGYITPDTGSILPFTTNPNTLDPFSYSRQFKTPGTYRYTNRFGYSAEIIVK